MPKIFRAVMVSKKFSTDGQNGILNWQGLHYYPSRLTSKYNEKRNETAAPGPSAKRANNSVHSVASQPGPPPRPRPRIAAPIKTHACAARLKELVPIVGRPPTCSESFLLEPSFDFKVKKKLELTWK